MARFRMTKPSFCTNRKVVACCRDARLLFQLMWMFCDDHGVHVADPKTLKMEVFPGDDLLVRDIAGWLDELVENQLLVEYENGGERYLWVTGWHHQRIEKPYYKYPLPTDAGSKIVRGSMPGNGDSEPRDSGTIPQPVAEDSTTIPGAVDDHSAQEVKLSKVKRKASKTVEATRPVDRATKSAAKGSKAAKGPEPVGKTGNGTPDSSNSDNGERSIQELAQLRIDMVAKKLAADPRDKGAVNG